MSTLNIISINIISLNWSHVFLCICMLIYLIYMHTHNPYVYINISHENIQLYGCKYVHLIHASVIKMYMLTTYTSIPRYTNYKHTWMCIQRDTYIHVYTQRHMHMCKLMYNQLKKTMFTYTEINVYIICIFSYKIQNYNLGIHLSTQI